VIFNLGDGTAILNRDGVTLAGRFAWWLKDGSTGVHEEIPALRELDEE